MASNDELLDLVDENDHVVGNKLRSEVYAEGLSNFRVINAFIVNSNGELWIPRRTANKRIFPLCFDMSVGGHVESGDDYFATFKRETEEELNIDIEKVEYKLLGHLSPKKDGVSAFMNVYEIRLNETPGYNKNDFIEYFWLKPKDLLDLLGSGEKSKDDLPVLVKKFYSN